MWTYLLRRVWLWVAGTERTYCILPATAFIILLFQQYEPTCAVCRSSLYLGKPLLPNFSADNFVRQHLQALARSGRPEWQEKGYRTIEWNKRAEFVLIHHSIFPTVLIVSRSWKKQADARATKEKLKAPRVRRRQPRYYGVEDYPYVPPWLVDDGIDDDEALIPRAIPRRGTRSRH